MIPKWLKIKYEDLSTKDKQFVIMNALKTAGMVLEGSNAKAEEVCKYTDYLIEHYYIFEAIQKPSYDNFPKKVNKKKEEEPF